MESLTYIRHRIKTPPPPSCRRHHTAATAYHCRAAPLVTAAAMWCSKQKGRGDTILRIWTFSSEEKIGSTFFVMHAEKKGTWAPPVQFILWFATSLFTSKNRDDRTELLQGPAPLCVDMGFRGCLDSAKIYPNLLKMTLNLTLDVCIAKT